MAVYLDERDYEPMPDTSRRQKALVFDLDPTAEATPEVLTEPVIRQAAHNLFETTLPGCIEIETAFRDDGSCRVIVIENPDELEK